MGRRRIKTIPSKPQSSTKMQSAMEYLMTYGWAVLIIAVVLYILFTLGVFNPNFFAPTAAPGSCTVYRPDGPDTTSLGVTLTGVCGLSIPQFVFESRGVADYVVITNSSQPSSYLNIVNSITITAWVSVVAGPYHDVVDKEGQYGMKLDYDNTPHACSPSDNTGWCLEWDTSNDWTGYSYAIPDGFTKKWMFLAVSQTGNTKYWYADGALLGTEVVAGTMQYAPSNVAIGTISPGYTGLGGDTEWFNGAISNVQIYDVALSENSIQSLYDEGIGGPPIDLQDLTGWWPLNGDTIDYSGNGDNGNTNGITFNGGPWWTNYQLPST